MLKIYQLVKKLYSKLFYTKQKLYTKEKRIKRMTPLSTSIANNVDEKLRERVLSNAPLITSTSTANNVHEKLREREYYQMSPSSRPQHAPCQHKNVVICKI